MDAGKRAEFLSGRRGLRGPAWRYKTAQELARSNNRQQGSVWDRVTLDTARYLILSAAGGESCQRAAADYPLIGTATAVQADDAKTDVIKLMLLADMPVDEVGKRVGLDPAVVDVWEQLFFDVRGLRAAVGWLAVNVLEAERKVGKTALAARMKLVLLAGVPGFNAILALNESAPVDEAEKLFQRKLKLNLKFDEAVDMPIVTEAGRMRFIQLHVELLGEEKRLELAEKKLAARCAEARDRFELGKMRMECAQEKAVVKASKRREAMERRDQASRNRNAAKAQLRELRQHAQQTEQNAIAFRVAQSPLSRLPWGPSNFVSPPPAATAKMLRAHNRKTLSTKEAAARHTEFDSFEFSQDGDRSRLELITQGAE